MIAVGMLFLSLGLDTLAVALGLGLSGLPRSRWLRVGLVFACYEGLMPIVGLFIGQHLSHFLGAAADYVAALLLIVLGILAVRESLSEEDEDKSLLVEGPAILWTGLTVSLDELALGFSLGVLHVALGPALGYIAFQAFALTYLGLYLGQRLGKHLGEHAEFASGIVLILLGMALLISAWTGKHFL
jgi:putative Mn2+ efflux pump MntP